MSLLHFSDFPDGIQPWVKGAYLNSFAVLCPPLIASLNPMYLYWSGLGVQAASWNSGLYLTCSLTSLCITWETVVLAQGILWEEQIDGFCICWCHSSLTWWKNNVKSMKVLVTLHLGLSIDGAHYLKPLSDPTKIVYPESLISLYYCLLSLSLFKVKHFFVDDGQAEELIYWASC